MIEKYYNPGTTGLILKFRCKDCCYLIQSDEMAVPQPDFSTDSARDSYNDNEEEIVCDECGAEHTVVIWIGRDEGGIKMEELKETSELEIEEISGEYDNELYYEIADDKQLYEIFKSEIDKLTKLNSINLNNSSLNQILKRQIFIGTIIVLETFLSDTFINMVLGNDNYLQNFTKTSPDFSKETIHFAENNKEYTILKEKVKQKIINMVYHRLEKIKDIYQNTFNIEFPEIEDLRKEINTRHDLVHRGGKTKDGKILEITTRMNNKVIICTLKFVYDISIKLNLTEPASYDIF